MTIKGVKEMEQITSGNMVRFQGRLYTVGSGKLHLVHGPHFRLIAEGNYSNEKLTSVSLLELVGRGTRK